MAVTITWPRHPRAGCSANSARATTISGKYWVQLRNTSNTYVNAMQVTTLKRAQDIAKRLNDLAMGKWDSKPYQWLELH